MCGAYGFMGVSGFKASINIWLRYNLENKPKPKDTYNIRPTMNALVVKRKSPNQGEYIPFGFEAPWKPGLLLINAKSETVSTLRTFSKMFRDSRCLVPASFYFEWRKNADGTKTPFLFRLKKGESFSFAGLYNDLGFVILTTSPNKLSAPIHHRMPVVLQKDQEDIWLNPDSTESDLTDLFAPYPDNEMESYPVSKLINSAANQGKEVIEKST